MIINELINEKPPKTIDTLFIWAISATYVLSGVIFITHPSIQIERTKFNSFLKPELNITYSVKLSLIQASQRWGQSAFINAIIFVSNVSIRP